METNIELSREILFEEFHKRWKIEDIKNMKLEDYVSVGDKDTFCQWLETKTRQLGSIKGINSSKFGIYKRGDKTKKPQNLINDNEYSWQKFYSDNNGNEAFENVKVEILKIIDYSQKGQFDKIDQLHLNGFVKWKIAYLFSNERLIPIFKKEALLKIAQSLGLETTNKTTISEIQNLIINKKPLLLSIYEYSDFLYNEYVRKEAKPEAKSTKTKRIERKGTTSRNANEQSRSSTNSYIAQQKHNQLQTALKDKLVRKYGAEYVILEENFVDIKVKLKDRIIIYEVKSSAYAENCVREALGQIISYSQRETEFKDKKLIVAGQYKPNDDELKYINYIKENLKLDFEYEHIDLD